MTKKFFLFFFCFLFRSGLIVMGDLPKWKNTKKGSQCDGWPTQVKKERKENEGSKVHSNEWSRARRRAQKENKGSKARSKRRRGLKGALEGSDGSKARSKGKRGLNGALEGKRGLKGALEREARAQRHARKEIRAWKRPKNDDQRLEGAFEGR
jgi:hypothetical protein